MKKLLIILAMMFIGCSESGNSVASFDFEQPGVENDSTEIVIDTTIDTNDSVKDTIIDNNEDTVVVSSSSSSSELIVSSSSENKVESSSSMENENESSSSENDIVSSSSSSSELIVSSSSENKVESSSSSKIAESSSSEEIVNSSSSKIVEISSSSVDEDYVDENEPKRELLSFVELDELKLNGFRVENNIAYLSWENNTDYTMQINVEYHIECVYDDESYVYVDSTIMYTIKANSVKEKAIYEIKNDDKKCVGHVKTITATENDKSNFYGWKMGSDLGIENIIFEN